MSRLPWVWGATSAEVLRDYPADRLIDPPARAMTRARTVGAPPEVLWRWLCQLSVAPYSYDWIDNRGRRSPRELTPGADELEIGQRIAVIFELVDLDDGHAWTGVTRSTSRLGRVAMTYAAEPGPREGTSRLVVRLVLGEDGLLGRAWTTALAWGDLVMIQKQVRVLAALAEQSGPVPQ